MALGPKGPALVFLRCFFKMSYFHCFLSKIDILKTWANENFKNYAAPGKWRDIMDIIAPESGMVLILKLYPPYRPLSQIHIDGMCLRGSSRLIVIPLAVWLVQWGLYWCIGSAGFLWVECFAHVSFLIAWGTFQSATLLWALSGDVPFSTSIALSFHQTLDFLPSGWVISLFLIVLFGSGYRCWLDYFYLHYKAFFVKRLSCEGLSQFDNVLELGWFHFLMILTELVFFTPHNAHCHNQIFFCGIERSAATAMFHRLSMYAANCCVPRVCRKKSFFYCYFYC